MITGKFVIAEMRVESEFREQIVHVKLQQLLEVGRRVRTSDVTPTVHITQSVSDWRREDFEQVRKNMLDRKPYKITIEVPE